MPAVKKCAKNMLSGSCVILEGQVKQSPMHFVTFATDHICMSGASMATTPAVKIVRGDTVATFREDQ